VEPAGGGYTLVGPAPNVGVINEFLGYLIDRNYSCQTVRAYAYDLLHFTRWLSGEQLILEAVDIDVLLRYLSACRTAVLAHQQGGNVYSIRDGRNAGYAPKTVNRRLAALSALFAFRAVREPGFVSPVPRGREARQTVRGERAGCLATSPHRRHGRGCECVSRGGSRAAWTGLRRRRCSEASTPCATGRSPGWWSFLAFGAARSSGFMSTMWISREVGCACSEKACLHTAPPGVDGWDSRFFRREPACFTSRGSSGAGGS